MFDDTLDFHDLGKLEPNQIKFHFDTFIENSFTQGNNYLLVITGKGETKIDSVGLAKRNVLFLLKTNKYILKFKQADESCGGSGAFEIWLKD